MEIFPTGAFDDLVEAFTERAAGDAQSIHGARIWLNQIVAAKFNRVHAEVVRDFIHVYFYSIARLRRSMTALWTTGRLIGEEAHALELIRGQLVCHRLQCARVIRGCYAVGTVSAAIQE